MFTSQQIVNHLTFGYLRHNQSITHVSLHSDIAGIVLHYIDVENTNYYLPPIQINPMIHFLTKQNLKMLSECAAVVGNTYIIINIKEDNELSIINMYTNQVTSLHTTVDFVTIHPVKNIMALITKNKLKLYDIIRKKMSQAFSAPDAIKYCQWLTEDIIAYITQFTVYQYSMQQKINLKSNPHNQSTSAMDICCVNEVKIDETDTTFISHIEQSGSFTKLHIKSLNVNSDNSLFVVAEQMTPINFERTDDRIITMIASNRYDCIYLISYFGMIFIFDINTATQIYSKKISKKLLSALPHFETGGLITFDSEGNVAIISFKNDTLITYIIHTLHNAKLAASWATKYDLPGARPIFHARFAALMEKADSSEKAAKLAADAPNGCLRTLETIQKLQSAPQSSGKPPADLLYYTFLLQRGALNKTESVCFCKRILQFKPSGGMAKIEQFLKEEKLEHSEELDDLLARHNPRRYFAAKANPSKLVLCFIQLGQSSKIVQYCKTNSYAPKWEDVLSNVSRMNRADTASFAKQLVQEKYLSATQVVEVLCARNDVMSATEFLLDYLQLRGDSEDDGELQTKLFEINLRCAPQVADAIFESDLYIFTHYDTNHIAHLCESAQLFDRALLHFHDLSDIKRVLKKCVNILSPDFVFAYFGGLTAEYSLSCLSDLLDDGNVALVVDVAKRYSKQLTCDKLIDLFEKCGAWEGLYSYLATMINGSKDKKLIFKYIVAAAHIGQFSKIELICRENDYYDPEQVKTYLLKSELITSLIHVCDRYGFYTDLAKYLYGRNLHKFIEVYLDKMRPTATPLFVGVILDMNPLYFMIAHCLTYKWMRAIIYDYIFGHETPKQQIRKIVEVVNSARYCEEELKNEFHARNMSEFVAWIGNDDIDGEQ